MNNSSAAASLGNTTPVPLPSIRIRSFQAGDETAFRTLNEEWIVQFGIESKDRIVLGDPVGHVLRPGGHIFFVVLGDVPIGCCALLAMGPGEFELAKMAVSERYRGLGIGRQLLEYAVAQARTFGARRLYLESNSRLQNAIHLYESVGFRHLPPERVPPPTHIRANLFMEMLLE